MGLKGSEDSASAPAFGEKEGARDVAVWSRLDFPGGANPGLPLRDWERQFRRQFRLGDKPEAYAGVLIAANRRGRRGRISGLGLAERVGAGGEVGVEASSLCRVEGGEHLFLHGGHSR